MVDVPRRNEICDPVKPACLVVVTCEGSTVMWEIESPVVNPVEKSGVSVD